jgi:hypothetical protein
MKLTFEYIAGFFDGDGCVSCSLIKQASGRYKSTMMPHVGFFSQNLEVLMDVMETLQCGDILACIGSRQAKRGVTGAYRWECPNPDIPRVLQALLPHLRIKREQAKVMLMLMDTRCSTRVEPDRMLEVVVQREVLVARLQELNRRDSQAYKEKWVNSEKLSKSCRSVARYETTLSQAGVPFVSPEGAETRSLSGNNNSSHERPLPKGNDIVRTVQ